MEPSKQVEIQLGHMCNNRCVFCVSGQRTAMGEALPLDGDPIISRIDDAFADGNRKITLLGGEPTLQPEFLRIVRHCVDLGFEEIVIFTNGVKTAREGFVDEVLETGGTFTWRISLQGANKAHHERTTKKPRSFDRIMRSMEHLRRKGQRITVNMCVVESNYESVDEFPALVLPFGVDQLHLDMIRPLDSGVRTEEEMAAMLPRYSSMVGPLTRMIEGFPEGFDVNIGNLPYCIAPHLAPWIHHDGEETATIAIDNDDQLSQPWDKYDVKRRDKFQPSSCRECLFTDRCSGVFETYEQQYGLAEFVPVGPEVLAAADPTLKLLPFHLKPLLESLGGARPPAPFEGVRVEESGDREVSVTLTGSDPLALVLLPAGPGLSSFERFSLHYRIKPADAEVAREGLTWLWTHFVEQGEQILHPLGDDAFEVAAVPLQRRLDRLRAAAPFEGLRWLGVGLSDQGNRAELELATIAGDSVRFWLEDTGGRIKGGYDVVEGQPSEALVTGLQEIRQALKGGPRRAESQVVSSR